ncbi:hypothetical protein [Methylobacterium planeticum]|uniref:Uncharacterized protein n=1 Tax=Methylobacterium planeticum TaxID=2615211 RepID=A0A6N6MFG8_9HYPH|nr:hypothetical protein [Methylobacterium planeticum]KAB1068494.1 hypothetical protein F6X51_26920 [Methylobacterium planeticum]
MPPGRAFNVAVRVKTSPPAAAESPAPAEPRLPRLRPCEIAAAAGLEAVRRALDDLLSGHAPA